LTLHPHTIQQYTGATAAQLTSIALTGDVRDRNDLKGKSVVTWTEYVPPLVAMGIPAHGLPWANASDEAAMIKWVKDERAAALVMHESWVRYVTSMQCDLSAAGLAFEVTDTGIAMPLRAPAVLMEDIDRAIMQLAGEGTLEKMKTDLVINAGGSCTTPTVKKAKVCWRMCMFFPGGVMIDHTPCLYCRHIHNIRTHKTNTKHTRTGHQRRKRGRFMGHPRHCRVDERRRARAHGRQRRAPAPQVQAARGAHRGGQRGGGDHGGQQGGHRRNRGRGRKGRAHDGEAQEHERRDVAAGQVGGVMVYCFLSSNHLPNI
jgi:hypothetical protein